jgi:hypothetical protein
MCFALALFHLVGCATTRHEEPPGVFEQPPDITAGEAAAAGLKAERDRPPALSVQEIRARSATVPPALDFPQRLDEAHDRIYSWAQGVVEATDHRFASRDEELKPTPAAPFRLGLVLESIDRSDGKEFGLDANLDIALSLPNIEERLRIFITSDDLDESPRGARDSTGLRAGLRYPLLRHLEFDVGVRLDIAPVAFTSVKWSRQVPLGRWDFYPFAKVFAETKESVGTAAGVTFDRWSGRQLFRSATYAKWRADRDRTQWSQSLVYARAQQLIVPDRYGSYLRASDIGRGWGLRLQATGEDTREVTGYEAGVFYARPATTRWLFWSVETLVRWDRKYAWSADPGIRLGINALFWELARPAKPSHGS